MQPIANKASGGVGRGLKGARQELSQPTPSSPAWQVHYQMPAQLFSLDFCSINEDLSWLGCLLATQLPTGPGS